MNPAMEDRFGHLISYLRVSITDRCNERCQYCMPHEEQDWLPRSEVLSYEEILRVLRVGAGMGISKVRITGGEVILNGRDILKGGVSGFRELRGREVCYVAQSAAAAFNPAHRLMDQVIEASLSHGLSDKAEAQQRAVVGVAAAA